MNTTTFLIIISIINFTFFVLFIYLNMSIYFFGKSAISVLLGAAQGIPEMIANLNTNPAETGFPYSPFYVIEKNLSPGAYLYFTDIIDKSSYWQQSHKKALHFPSNMTAEIYLIQLRQITKDTDLLLIRKFNYGE